MKNKIAILVLFICLVMIGVMVIAFLNMDYPRVGHDYSFFVPSIIDNALFYLKNGIHIEWYTLSFGGGVPVYPDPNFGTFSLPVLLAIILPAWWAVIISTVVYILIGGFLCCYFFKKVLELHWTSSILGTIFFMATGFYMQGIAVGHLSFQCYPLLAVFLISIFDSTISKWVAGAVMALTVAYLIVSSGYPLLIIFGFSLLLIFPMIYIFRPKLLSFSRIGFIIITGGFLAMLLSASKLGAVYAFMRYFPRTIADSYDATLLQGLSGILLQLFGTMTMAPFVKLIGGHPSLLDAYMAKLTGAVYGYWEFDMSLSPVVFGILFVGTAGVVRNIKKYGKRFFSEKRWIAWIFLGFSTWLTIEFILAKGLFYPILRQLPVLSSLHVNPRFTASLIFPLAFLAAVIFNHWVVRWSARKSLAIFSVLTILTFVPLSTYFMITGDLQERNYEMTDSNLIYRMIRSGDPMNVAEIASGISNTQAILQYKSNLEPYDPIFGYQLENFHPEIHPGSVWDVSDGYYNLTNPAGYVFPELNGTRAFERIKVGDENNMEMFINHKLPDWKIPTYQKVLNWVSGVTFGVISLSLLVYGFTKKAKIKPLDKRAKNTLLPHHP